MSNGTDKPIGYWVRSLDGLLETLLDRDLADMGVGRRHWQLLNTLQAGPLEEGALAERLRPFWREGAITLAEVIGDLTERGWLEPDGAGRHRLTAGGRAAHARLAERIAATRRHLAEGVTAEEYAVTVDVLRRMTANARARL